MNYSFAGILTLCLLSLAFGARIKRKTEEVSRSDPAPSPPPDIATEVTEAVAGVDAEVPAATVISNNAASCDLLNAGFELVECSQPLLGVDPSDMAHMLSRAFWNPQKICPVFAKYSECIPNALGGCGQKYKESYMAPLRAINHTLQVLGCRSDVPKSTCSESVSGSVTRSCASRWLINSCRSSKVQCKCPAGFKLGGPNAACNPNAADVLVGRKFDSDKYLDKNCTCVPDAPEVVAEELNLADAAVNSVNSMASCSVKKVKECGQPLSLIDPMSWMNPDKACPALNTFVSCVPDVLSNCSTIVKTVFNKPLEKMQKVVDKLGCKKPEVPIIPCEDSVPGSVTRNCSRRWIFRSCRSSLVQCKCEVKHQLDGSDPACDHKATDVILGRKFDGNKLNGKGCTCIRAPLSPPPQAGTQIVAQDPSATSGGSSSPSQEASSSANSASPTDKVGKSSAFSSYTSCGLLLGVALAAL